MAKKIITTYDLYTGNVPADLKKYTGKGLRDALSGLQGNPFVQGTEAQKYFNQLRYRMMTDSSKGNTASELSKKYELVNSYEVPEQKQIAEQFGKVRMKGGRFYTHPATVTTQEDLAAKLAEREKIKSIPATDMTPHAIQTKPTQPKQETLGSIAGTPPQQQPTSKTETPEPKVQKTIIDIYNERIQKDPAFRDVFAQNFPGQDPFQKGTNANKWLNDWWNSIHTSEYPNVILTPPTSPPALTEKDIATKQSAQTTQTDTGEITPPKYMFDGNTILVRFSDDPTPTDPIDDANSTVWLYDKSKGTYRPIGSMEALEALTGKSRYEVAPYINNVSTTVLSSPDWKGKFIARKDAIQDDGTIPETAEFIYDTAPPAETGGKPYGKEIDVDRSEYYSKAISNILDLAENKGIISQATIDKYMSDDTLVSKYIAAITNGGYAFRDICKDLMAKQLADEGNENYRNVKTFDETMPASQWYNTEEYRQVANDSNLMIPYSTLNIDPGLFTNPIFQIPDEAWSSFVQPIDITSPKFKAEAEKIQASYYDIMMQKAEATTEQAKALADNNWKLFKEDIQKRFNIAVSDNAQTAWGQLQKLFTGYGRRGLAGSGLFNEAMDRYLADVRKQNQRLRDAKISDEELQQRNYLLKNGSPEQIRAFAEANPEKAKEWGLIPSDEVLAWFSTENLKKEYPGLPEEDYKLIKDMLIDESGYYRSELQQTLYTNKYNLTKEKREYQEQELLRQRETEQKIKAKPFTSAPFLKGALEEGQYKYGDEEGVVSPATPPVGPDYASIYKEMLGRDIKPEESAHHQTHRTGEEHLRNWLAENKSALTEAPVTPPVVTPPVSAPLSYADLIDRNGTIYTTTGKAYSDPAQLAVDLGIRPHQIDWSKINKEEPSYVGTGTRQAAEAAGKINVPTYTPTTEDTWKPGYVGTGVRDSMPAPTPPKTTTKPWKPAPHQTSDKVWDNVLKKWVQK